MPCQSSASPDTSLILESVSSTLTYQITIFSYISWYNGSSIRHTLHTHTFLTILRDQRAYAPLSIVGNTGFQFTKYLTWNERGKQNEVRPIFINSIPIVYFESRKGKVFKQQKLRYSDHNSLYVYQYFNNLIIKILRVNSQQCDIWQNFCHIHIYIFIYFKLP